MRPLTFQLMLLDTAEDSLHALTPAALAIPADVAKGQLQLLLLQQKLRKKLLFRMMARYLWAHRE